MAKRNDTLRYTRIYITDNIVDGLVILGGPLGLKEGGGIGWDDCGEEVVQHYQTHTYSHSLLIIKNVNLTIGDNIIY